MRLPDTWKGPYWEPHDAWVGLYWTSDVFHVAKWEWYEEFKVFICLVPCLPIRVSWLSNAEPPAAQQPPDREEA